MVFGLGWTGAGLSTKSRIEVKLSFCLHFDNCMLVCKHVYQIISTCLPNNMYMLFDYSKPSKLAKTLQKDKLMQDIMN